MVALAVIAVLTFPVFLRTFATYAVVSFSTRVSEPGRVKWLENFSLMFLRFRSERYYFCLIHLLMSLLVAMVLTLLPNTVELQVVLMMGILTMYLTVQVPMRPWRTDAANHVDAYFTCGLIIIMGSSAMLVEPLLDDA